MEKWFITLIQLWQKNEKQLTSNKIVCIICDFSFYSNPRSSIAACCVCTRPVWWSELEMKMCHLFHNPWQGSILNVNPSLLEMVTIRERGVGGGKGEGEDKSWRRMRRSIYNIWLNPEVIMTCNDWTILPFSFFLLKLIHTITSIVLLASSFDSASAESVWD